MKISFCKNCRIYTLREICKNCGKNTESPHPPKFSVEKEEKYGKYRRAAEIK
ncbi:MAG TPA: nucleolar RNA-binding Nop10p family protein [archaeon]|nr:nucleolar RNA-binding Nop10p family protein [archaeon]